MSESEQDAKIEAEPHEVLDPEQYNQNRRLKQIHEAREGVREALDEMPKGRATGGEWAEGRDRLATAVAYYGQELLPLLEQTEWEPKYPHLSDELRESMVSPQEFVWQNGRIESDAWKQDYTPRKISMAVFAELNRFAAEIGLGADFDDDPDEWEI